MRKVFQIFFVLTVLTTYRSNAQDTLSSKHFTVYAFAGPNFYQNNFQFFKSDVNIVNFTAGGRFMWEPGHRLSFGLNAAYYQVYTAEVKSSSASAHFRMVAVPVNLIMKMDLYKGIYALFGMGPSFCSNHITTSGGAELTGTWVSFADVTMAVGYQKLVRKKFSLGGEAGYFHSSKSKENVFSVMVVAGYKL